MAETGLRRTLGADVSRRAVLQGVGLGLAGLALAPRAAAVTLGASTDTVWTWQPDLAVAWGIPTLVAGRVLVFSSHLEGIVTCLDTRTGAELWSFTYPFGWAGRGSLSATTRHVFLAADEYVICLDLETGAQRWYAPYAASVDDLGNGFGTLTGQVVFATADGRLVSLSTVDGSEQWAVPLATGTGFVSRPLLLPDVGCIVAGDSVTVFDPTDGSTLYRLGADGAITRTPALVGGRLTVAQGATPSTPTATSRIVQVGVDTHDLELWGAPPNGQVGVISAPTATDGRVYYGDAGGRLTVVDHVTGAVLWQVTLEDADLSAARIVVEDGVVYLAGAGAAGARVYAVDVASQGQKVVTTDPGMVAPQVLGVETGVCYVTETSPSTSTSLNKARVLASTFASALHGFFAESQLMVESYTGDGTHSDGARPSGTSWRTHLQLVDQSGTPRSNRSVRVWSEAAVVVSSGGVGYAVGPDQPAWLVTDGAGELSVVVDAARTVTDTGANGLGCPALYVWGNFMAQDEAIVLYPDHSTMTQLSQVQGTHLSSATSYDGAPLLPSGYTATDSDHLAATIRGTMGDPAAALAATQRRVGAPPAARTAGRPTLGSVSGGFIAYPDSVDNLVYQPAVGPTARTYTQSADDGWTATFGAGGAVTFAAGASFDRIPAPDPGGLGSLWNTFEEFLEKLVHGAESISRIVWSVAKGAVQVIETVAGDVFKIVVDTVEKAVAVVAAILKTVVGDLVRVLEALSFVFDWSGILALHRQIAGEVRTGFAEVTTWASRVAAAGTVPALFTTAAGEVSAAFDSATASLSGRSALAPPSSGDPQTFYGAGGAKSYTTSRWMTEKVKENAGGTVPGASAAATAAATSDLGTLLGDLSDTIATQAGKSFAALPADLTRLVSDLARLVTDPSAVGRLVLVDVLDVIRDLVTGVITFAGDLAGDLLGSLGPLLDGVLGVFTAPLHIPVLTPLYTWLTGDDLSVLDLVALIVAIPSTIVAKALGIPVSTGATRLRQGVALGAAKLPGILEVVLCAALGLYTVLDPLIDWLSANPAPLPQDPVAAEAVEKAEAVFLNRLGVISSVVSTLALGLSFPLDLATNNTPTYVVYALQLTPIVLGVAGIAGLSASFGPKWEAVQASAQIIYGVLLLGTAATFAHTDPEHFLGTDALVLLTNIAASVPYLMKWAGAPVVEAHAGAVGLLVAVDIVCDLGVLGLAVAQYLVD